MKAGKKNSNKEKRLTGKVVIKKFGKGSKSEHKGVYIETDKGTFMLRRMGGNPFHDPVLLKLVGKTITATGTIDQYQFLATKLEEDCT